MIKLAKFKLSFEWVVQAAYDKRTALGLSALDEMLDTEVISRETSRNGAVTVVWLRLDAECRTLCLFADGFL